MKVVLMKGSFDISYVKQKIYFIKNSWCFKSYLKINKNKFLPYKEKQIFIEVSAIFLIKSI